MARVGTGVGYGGNTFSSSTCSVKVVKRPYSALDLLKSSGPEIIKLFSCSTQLSMKF